MQTPIVSVIVPTYQERDNLAELLPALHQVLSAERIAHELIVVDDDSADGTEELSVELKSRFNHRLIIRKDERGLATAVLDGVRAAKGEILVVMDADLSHPPESVPKLVDKLESSNAAIAVGSRYTSGGSIDPHWSMKRRLVSRTASLLARPLTGVKDPMSGFFAFRRSAVPNPGELNPTGFKIGLELLVKADTRNVPEVPIHFKDRLRGESKFNLGQVFEYLQHVTRLYLWRMASRKNASSV